ncbi:MAG: hypothetical protein IID40_10925, partial [Planctomycetes bacterium]|nr:hypothetical protein [Planctomycetota bacterium]
MLDMIAARMPALSSPPNGAVNVAARPTLSWSSVTGANKYWLTIATSLAALPTDPNATACPGCVVTVNLTGTSYTPPADLAFSATHYWQVQAY